MARSKKLKATAFFKDKEDGKIKPITEPQSTYAGQTSEASWSKSSVQDLKHTAKKEHREHPWTTQDQALQIAKDHDKLQRKDSEPIVMTELSLKPSRREVLESEEYKLWWKNRKEVQPIPGDPYRAFMIDRSLEAKLTNEGAWGSVPNRSDFEPVDFPPTAKGRRLKTLEEPKGEYVEGTKKRLRAQELEICKKMNVPAPEIRFATGVDASYYSSGYWRNKTTGEITKMQEPHILIGLSKSGKHYATLDGTLAHELGHHKKIMDLERSGGKEAVARFYTDMKYSKQATNESERDAWREADPYMTNKRAVQNWHKKYAFGTYLGTTPGFKNR